MNDRYQGALGAQGAAYYEKPPEPPKDAASYARARQAQLTQRHAKLVEETAVVQKELADIDKMLAALP